MEKVPLLPSKAPFSKRFEDEGSAGRSGAVNGNIKSLPRRRRGYKNLHYLLLKAQRMAATRTEFVVFKKAA